MITDLVKNNRILIFLNKIRIQKQQNNPLRVINNCHVPNIIKLVSYVQFSFIYPPTKNAAKIASNAQSLHQRKLNIRKGHSN